MRPGETVRAALRGLRRRPLRNGLALVGVILATATLVALLALSTAARAQVLGGLEEQPMITTIQVTPATQRAGVAPRSLDAAAVEAISSVAGVREVMPIVVVPATLRLGGRSPSGTVTGVTPRSRTPYALGAGRAPTPAEPDATVLTPAGLRAIGGSAEDAVGLRAQLEVRRTDTSERRMFELMIVGVASTEIPGVALVPLALAEDAQAWIVTGESSTARDLRLAQQTAAALLFGGQLLAGDLGTSRYSTLWVLARSLDDVRPVKAAIEQLGYAAFNPEAVIATVDDLFRAVNALLIAVALAAFVLAGLGILNALVTTVSERTVEIGVLKALGARDRDIARMFLAEGVVLGVIGGVLGSTLGWAAAAAGASIGRAAAGATHVQLAPQPDLALASIAVAAAVVLAGVGAWLPARSAARMTPAAALRTA